MAKMQKFLVIALVVLLALSFTEVSSEPNPQDKPAKADDGAADSSVQPKAGPADDDELVTFPVPSR